MTDSKFREQQINTKSPDLITFFHRPLWTKEITDSFRLKDLFLTPRRGQPSLQESQEPHYSKSVDYYSSTIQLETNTSKPSNHAFLSLYSSPPQRLKCKYPSQIKTRYIDAGQPPYLNFAAHERADCSDPAFPITPIYYNQRFQYNIAALSYNRSLNFDK